MASTRSLVWPLVEASEARSRDSSHLQWCETQRQTRTSPHCSRAGAMAPMQTLCSHPSQSEGVFAVHHCDNTVHIHSQEWNSLCFAHQPSKWSVVPNGSKSVRHWLKTKLAQSNRPQHLGFDLLQQLPLPVSKDSLQRPRRGLCSVDIVLVHLPSVRWPGLETHLRCAKNESLRGCTKATLVQTWNTKMSPSNWGFGTPHELTIEWEWINI